LLKVGDELLSFDLERDVYSTTTVTATKKTEAPTIVVINETLAVTSVHHLLTNAGWVRARELTISHMLRSVANVPVPVETIMVQKAKTSVHTIDTNQPFFAAGLLVGTFKQKVSLKEALEEKPVEIYPDGTVHLTTG
jgi:hypothetical protein